ncbi:hypothetical protein [Zobellia nedashkovskayae]|uniref:hypothetical protein n=1 Tax=Zobellia nedashkovskayae TaxID=2779510 RepID=UPI00188D8E01|nr:hypothetical protein [Zobellia nedashkovskayae]
MKKTILQLISVFMLFIVVSCGWFSKDKEDDKTTNSIETENKDVSEEKRIIQLKAVKIDSTISCTEAKRKWLENECDSFDECSYYAIVAKKCDLANHNAKNPNDQKTMIAKVEVTEDGEQKILFGLIDLEDGVEVATYSKVALALVTGNAFTDDPVTGSIVDAIGTYSIDAYLESAIENDELIIFYPTGIPTKKMVQDVFDELKDNKEIKKITYELKQIGKDGIEHLEDNPEAILNPSTSLSIELAENGIKTVEKVVDKAGKTIKEHPEIVALPILPLPADDIKKVLHKPTDAPKVIGKRIEKIIGIKF